jgi:hypothetical protein
MIIIMPLLSLYMALSYYYQWGDKPLTETSTLIIVVVFLLIMLTFYNLTVSIKGRIVELKFGIGLIKFKLHIDQLHEASTLRTKWWYGWGIRFTPHGMLYNIYGRDAVKIKFTGKGKTKNVLIGTPEPEELLKHINQLK